jgi:cobalamin biosynthesis protein CobD/CbiB
MAGALQARLGGTNFYDGEVVSSPLIGAKFTEPTVRQAKQSIQIVAVVSALGIAAALLLRGTRR